MPKQTFFNLAPEKRRTIERAALDEFAEYGFDHSNMNRIVEASKIAKGSFYQYFEDKKDLYFHLIGTLVTRKMEVMSPVLAAVAQHTFSHNLEALFRAGLAFADSDPKFYRLGEDFAVKQPSFTREFVERYNPVAIDIYGKLLERARETGELREDIDIPLTASFVSSLINQTSVGLIDKAVTRERRGEIIAELIAFIERAVLASSKFNGHEGGTRRDQG